MECITCTLCDIMECNVFPVCSLDVCLRGRYQEEKHVVAVMFNVMVTVISMFTTVIILNIVIIMMALSARYMKSICKEWCQFSPAVGA